MHVTQIYTVDLDLLVMLLTVSDCLFLVCSRDSRSVVKRQRIHAAFFYNKKTRSWICGATTYPNLKAWAYGKPHERFLPPPKEETEYIQGIRGWLEKLRDEGIKRMQKRTESNSSDK